MHNIKSILVCVDPNRTQMDFLDRAADLAQKDGIPIKLVHVIGEFPKDMSEWWNVRNPKKLHDKIVREREGFLESMAEHLRQRGAEHVSYELKWGKAFLEITKEVMQHGHDLVMVTAQRSGKLGRWFRECPSMDLMRHCPAILWVSKGKLAQRHKRVLATLGWKGGQVQCDAMNSKILRTAAAIAAAEGCELHVAHALPLYGGKGLKGNKLRSDLVSYLDELRDEVNEKCGGVVTEYGTTLTNEQIHLLTGAPASVIPEFANETGFDLIVMGTVARTGIPGLLVGNTAEKVFALVDSSIVAVKPLDYVSVVQMEPAREVPDPGEARLAAVEQELARKKRELEEAERELAEKKAALEKQEKQQTSTGSGS